MAALLASLPVLTVTASDLWVLPVFCGRDSDSRAGLLEVLCLLGETTGLAPQALGAE